MTPNKYLLLSVAVLMLVVSVSGLALDFQNPSDFSAQVDCIGVGGCSWTQNTSGGNSYVYTPWTSYIVSQTALPMTYSAATLPVAGNLAIVMLYDSGRNVIGQSSGYGLVDRVEMKMIGGEAHFFSNGVDMEHTGVLAVNPSYVGWDGFVNPYGAGNVDDIIWGDTEPKYIFGMPESGYFLMKDILNPANSGFFRVNQTDPTGAPTLITSYNFTSTFGKNNGNDEIVTLESPTGGVQQTYHTDTAYAGEIYWDLVSFFASNAPYGLYRTEIAIQTNSTGFATSEWIPYIGSGASIQFDKNSYAVGEEAQITVVISDGYYDTGVYAYHVVIQDIFGTEVYDEPISFSALSPYTGLATYQWTDDKDEGVYYGLIYATQLSDNEELLMNYDTADLNSVLVINGYVKDAETTNTIAGATVNITQGVTTDSVSSGADGNYTSVSNFVANAPTTIKASAAGYENGGEYTHTFTPLYAGTIQINLTLMPTSPTYTGIALGGIARTPPYNRTIDSATVTINKAGIGNYLVTTNSAGYYIQNSMPNGTIWDVWGAKSGFSNSTIYQKLVVGI